MSSVAAGTTIALRASRALYANSASTAMFAALAIDGQLTCDVKVNRPSGVRSRSASVK